MHMVPFDYTTRRFNEYGRFSCTPANAPRMGCDFIQFETGEVILTDQKFHPDARRMYEKLGIEIVATGDTGVAHRIEMTDPSTGDVVNWASVGRPASQTLLIDWHHGQVVNVGFGNPTVPGIPQSLAPRCTVYWGGPDMAPTARKPLTIGDLYKPDQAWHDLLAACRAWASLQGITENTAFTEPYVDGDHIPGTGGSAYAAGYYRTIVVDRLAKGDAVYMHAVADAVLQGVRTKLTVMDICAKGVPAFSDLGYYTRVHLALRGAAIKSGVVTREVPFLNVTRKEV